MDMKQKIGCVGVGRMGANMVRRLAETGFKISAVYDARKSLAEALAKEIECEAAADLATITAKSDVILTVVSDDQAMRQIYRGGLLSGARGRLFINFATVSPGIHVWVETQAGRAGARSLEACMASSIPQARQGRLYLMCAGRKEAFEEARPILEKLGSEILHMGPAGKAAQVKALVNMVMNANTAALAEGLGLGQALGLDLTMLREVFARTGARSGVLETDGEDMQLRQHECFFSADHAAKDSGIALKLARSEGLKLPVAAAAGRQFARLAALGLGALDKSAVAELTFKDRHGLD